MNPPMPKQPTLIETEKSPLNMLQRRIPNRLAQKVAQKEVYDISLFSPEVV